MSNKKTLRQKYLSDPAARKFLADHPEFDDRFLDQSIGPQWDLNKGRYTLKEVAPDQDIYGTVMLEALRALPENHVYRPLLEEYYIQNLSLNELLTRHAPSINGLWQKLHRAKKAALKAWVRPKAIKNPNPAIEERTFVYKEKSVTLYLRRCDYENDFVWTLKDGTVLPETIQEILDTNSEYKEWDLIFIDALT